MYQEGTVIAKDVLHIIIQAAGTGVAIRQKMIVSGNHQHDDKSNQQTQNRAQGSCLGQIGLTGDDKRAPANRTAYGQSPDSQRRKIGLQTVTLADSVCLLLHCISSDHRARQFSICDFKMNYKKASWRKQDFNQK